MRCGRVASAAAWHRCGVCLWMSFASGVQCMAQLAVGTLRLPKGAPRPVRRRSVRGHKDRPTGGLANSLWCTAAGAVLALAVQLLLCCCGASSPDPPDACAACADATRQQREIPRDKGTGDGQERCWTAGRARLSASRIHVRGSASVDRHSTTTKTSPIDPVHTRASTQTCSTVRQIISPIQAFAVIPPHQWVPCSGPKRAARCSPRTPSPRAGTALTGSVQRIVPTTPVTSARRDPVARPAASPTSSRSGLQYVMGPPTRAPAACTVPRSRGV